VRASLGTEIIAVKWCVKRDGRYFSPCWGNAQELEYVIGHRIEVADAVESEQQCAAGLHVFWPGIHPRNVGLDDKPDLVPIACQVDTKDLLFVGWPGTFEKIRVRALVPLREITICQS
jgi:hypothetical protein